MGRTDIWHRLVILAERLLQVTSGLDLPTGGPWHAVVAAFLVQTNEFLDSVRMLLKENSRDSAVILTRSLFEFAVNLAYIAKDTSPRLPEFLEHGGIPTTAEEINELREKLALDTAPEAGPIVPGRAWKGLKSMCEDLGPDWVKEYQTFYRLASVSAHGGSYTLGTIYKRLLEQGQASDHDNALVLVSALAFHLRVAEIAGTLFPTEISPDKIKEMRTECREIGQVLAKG
jgi:hypothetical protein